jgi:hypothetical protein
MNGAAVESMISRTREARAMFSACPSSPKPVISVAACAPAASIASAARSLSVVIAATASSSSSGAIASRLRAVVRMPVPSGLVSTSASPIRAPALVTICCGPTIPVTAMPYFGSASLIV